MVSVISETVVCVWRLSLGSSVSCEGETGFGLETVSAGGAGGSRLGSEEASSKVVESGGGDGSGSEGCWLSDGVPRRLLKEGAETKVLASDDAAADGSGVSEKTGTAGGFGGSTEAPDGSASVGLG